MEIPCLPQLKFYLKIIGISYLIKNINAPINSDVIETILKNNHIFNTALIASKLCIIKVLPKSDMAIVQLDI